MFYAFVAVVTLMLETRNPRNSIIAGTCFFVETENFEYFRLSHLLIFVGLGPAESFGFFVAF